MEERYIAALRALILYDTAQGEYAMALDWLRLCVAAEPYDEPLHCLAMLLHIICTNPCSALRHYESYRDVLESTPSAGLGVSATVLHKLISSGQLSPQALVESIKGVLEDVHVNTGSNAGSLIGRILDRLDPKTRLAESEMMRQALRRAEEIARDGEFCYYGAPHILLALIEQRDRATDEIFRRLGLRQSDVEESLRTVIGRGEGALAQETKPSPHCKHRLDRARQRAILAKAPMIENLHLLEAILEDHQGLVVRLIAMLGVDRLTLSSYLSQ